MPITEPIDEDELEADLAALEQEKLDEQILTTGTTVPVSDSLSRMPAAADGPRKFTLYIPSTQTQESSAELLSGLFLSLSLYLSFTA